VAGRVGVAVAVGVVVGVAVVEGVAVATGPVTVMVPALPVGELAKLFPLVSDVCRFVFVSGYVAGVALGKTENRHVINTPS